MMISLSWNNIQLLDRKVNKESSHKWIKVCQFRKTEGVCGCRIFAVQIPFREQRSEQRSTTQVDSMQLQKVGMSFLAFKMKS
jgi:hypothetical protein